MSSSAQVWRTHAGMAIFWVAALAGMYLLMDYWQAPKAAQVQADGSVQLQRHRDGHFYAEGNIDGVPVRFMVDTGATAIAVTDALAEKAGLHGGERAVFRTANGEREGRMVRAGAVRIGPLLVRDLMVGTGYTSSSEDSALLGQNFLRRFDVIIRGDVMHIQPR